MNFAQKSSELEKILKNLEGDDVSLDDALLEYERGVALVRECRAYLNDAAEKVSVLSAEGKEEPFKAAKENADKGEEER